MFISFSIQGYCTQIPGGDGAHANNFFFTEVPNNVPPIWNFLYITLLAPRILKWFIEFKKTFYVPIVGF